AASMEDIQDLSHNREEVRQDLAPIDYISLTTEQVLFTQILDAQLESLVSSMRDSGKRQERIDSIKSSYIDNPNKELIYETRTRASVNRLKNGNISHLALPLKEMDIRNTSKYIKLMDIIKNSGDEKILIYANEYDLINNLKEALVLDGIKAFTIEGVNEEEYSSYINSAFQNHKVGIVDPLKVNVGIDIHAEQLVWYQFMEQIDKMIQAQRRICRLSSKGTSLVTLDRKSTRLNSSHVSISYAVFCLKKKNQVAVGRLHFENRDRWRLRRRQHNARRTARQWHGQPPRRQTRCRRRTAPRPAILTQPSP